MNTQPTLFEISRTSSGRRNTERERVRREIARLKREFGIFTHNAGFRERKDHPWSCLWYSEEVRNHYNEGYGEKFGPKDQVELIAGYCRLLEEQKLLVTGETERQAIKTLCEFNEIPNEL